MVSFRSVRDHLVNIDETIVLGIFVVTHPVIGILAQPLLAAKVIYHSIKWKQLGTQTKTQKGDFLRDKDISYFSNTEFQIEDLQSLENQLKATNHQKKYHETLFLMQTLAKCIIPIIGLIWAGKTCTSKEEEAIIGNLNQYINEIEDKIKSLKHRNITNITQNN
jgi:hypothetical protein